MQSFSVSSSEAETSPLERLEATLSHSEEGIGEIVTELKTESSAKLISTEFASIQPESVLQTASPEAVPTWKVHLQVFTSTFLTIFLAELGDKTQVTTLLMAAESHSPWVVFAGAGAALIATSAIGVWLGCWLAKRVSPQVLERSVGFLLLGVSALLVWDVIQG